MLRKIFLPLEITGGASLRHRMPLSPVEQPELISWLSFSSARLTASGQNKQKSCIVGAPKWVHFDVHAEDFLADNSSIRSCLWNVFKDGKKLYFAYVFQDAPLIT